MLCLTDLQPEVFFGTLEGRMGQYIVFNIFFTMATRKLEISHVACVIRFLNSAGLERRDY